MKINITHNNIESSDTIDNYVEKKMASISRFLKGDDVLVEWHLKKTTNHHRQAEDLYIAEVQVTKAGEIFNASHEHADLYAAIDLVKMISSVSSVASADASGICSLRVRRK